MKFKSWNSKQWLFASGYIFLPSNTKYDSGDVFTVAIDKSVAVWRSHRALLKQR